MTVDQVINDCEIDGNIVTLPDVQLDRKVYTQVAKKLEGIGGKWNRKENGFLFSNDPSELLGRVKEGESINLKKDFQFFETPDKVIDIMMTYFTSPKRVLEPSAGKGALIGRIPKGVSVTYCELNPLNTEYIKGQNWKNTEFACLDFMEFSTEEKFNLVIANPPFTKGQYCSHIQKMYEHLLPDGRIITVAPIGFQYATVGVQKKFNKWLEGVNHQIVPLPEGSFKSSGTMVHTCLIVIDKE